MPLFIAHEKYKWLHRTCQRQNVAHAEVAKISGSARAHSALRIFKVIVPTQLRSERQELDINSVSEKTGALGQIAWHEAIWAFPTTGLPLTCPK